MEFVPFVKFPEELIAPQVNELVPQEIVPELSSDKTDKLPVVFVST
jgi:hypothetical protein